MKLTRSVVASALVPALSFAVAACGGGDTSAAPTPTPSASETPPPCVPKGTALEIVANDIEFDRDCLAAPANQPFTIALDNMEAAIAHNVAIYPDLRSSVPLFKGEYIDGPAVTTYKVPALAAGEYRFRCDLHPKQMQGDFVVE